LFFFVCLFFFCESAKSDQTSTPQITHDRISRYGEEERK
jgi:hypothetical protein